MRDLAIRSFAAFLLAATALLGQSGEARFPDERQIFWQRTLDDALALASASKLPLLIAVNMDGESASDRIVRELYRDPAFVARTRGCVCLAASLFRHNPRDYDDDGRRIPCPRLGEITCGEHLALEPVAHDRYLADGERVAPRHALIRLDGTKAWDLSLSFDLRDIHRELTATVPEPAAAVEAPAGEAPDWAVLASRREHRGRSLLEQKLVSVVPRGGAKGSREFEAALEAIAHHGDAGSLDALRGVVMLFHYLQESFAPPILGAAKSLKLEAALAKAIRDGIRGVGRMPWMKNPLEQGLGPVALLAELEPASVGTRKMLLALRAVAAPEDAASLDDAIGRAFDAPDAAAVAEALAGNHGAVQVRLALALASQVTRHAAATAGASTSARLPRRGTITDAMPEREVLEAELAEIDRQTGLRESEWLDDARVAKIFLDLARYDIDTDPEGARRRLEWSEQLFGRALETQPDNGALWCERARAAYFAGRFADEAAFGKKAFACFTGRPEGRLLDEAAMVASLHPQATETSPDLRVLDDGDAIEALRWIGDGLARLSDAWAAREPGSDMAAMITALRALACVAASPYGDEGDWLGLASLCDALGLVREQFQVQWQAALRFPGSMAIREQVFTTLWHAGRIDFAGNVAESVLKEGVLAEAESAGEARVAWAYAWMLVAEHHRRVELPHVARADYRRAFTCLGDVAQLPDSLRDQGRLYAALAHFGTGMAASAMDQREAAAGALVEGVALWPQAKSGRDGLGYDVLDLVDRIFEWRETGASTVDPARLLERLVAADPEDPFWGIAIADALLREALRADGRNPDRVEHETVDASGKPIRMPMGRPNEEGDRYLRASIEVARKTRAISDSEDSRRTLAQSDTVWAERMLERGRPDEARESLVEAASLMKQEVPAPDADAVALAELAAKLRSELGPARPRWRDGR